MPLTFERHGGETLVNSTTANDQNEPSVAALEGGGYVVTWMSYNQGSLELPEKVLR